jgi:hypothetical protein
MKAVQMYRVCRVNFDSGSSFILGRDLCHCLTIIVASLIKKGKFV